MFVVSGAVVLTSSPAVPADAAAQVTLPAPTYAPVPPQPPLTPSASGTLPGSFTPETNHEPTAAPHGSAPSASRRAVPGTSRPVPSAAPQRSAPTRAAESANSPLRLTPPPPAGNLQARIYSVALGYVGRGGPYVYGGKSLTGGSDCSYLVYRILLDAGLHVPYRSSSALAAAYRAVPANQARAGDLVWKLGHIGVYDGHGGVIDHGAGFGAHHRSLWYSPTFLRVA